MELNNKGIWIGAGLLALLLAIPFVFAHGAGGQGAAGNVQQGFGMGGMMGGYGMMGALPGFAGQQAVSSSDGEGIQYVGMLEMHNRMHGTNLTAEDIANAPSGQGWMHGNLSEDGESHGSGSMAAMHNRMHDTNLTAEDVSGGSMLAMHNRMHGTDYTDGEFEQAHEGAGCG